MFDNFRAKFRNYFTKPTATPEPLEDAFNNVAPITVAYDYESFIDRVNRMLHDELTLARLHLQDMVAHEHATPKRPRILSKLQRTLDEVTHKLLDQENRMHRHGIAK